MSVPALSPVPVPASFTLSSLGPDDDLHRSRDRRFPGSLAGACLHRGAKFPLSKFLFSKFSDAIPCHLDTSADGTPQPPAHPTLSAPLYQTHGGGGGMSLRFGGVRLFWSHAFPSLAPGAPAKHSMSWHIEDVPCRKMLCIFPSPGIFDSLCSQARYRSFPPDPRDEE
jgi:hypothetical protein